MAHPTEAEVAMARIRAQSKAFKDQMDEDCGYGGPEPDPNAPTTEPVSMTADQQIRAKALECASRILERRLPEVAAEFGAQSAQDMIWDTLDHFERYISEGK